MEMAAQPNIEESMQVCIYRWAYRLLQDHHDALDATQEILLRSIALRPPGLENRQAWLRRVTINHCVDMLRRRRTRAPLRVDAVETATPVDEASARELHSAVLAGLDRISEQQRAVLVAKVYDQQTFASIAESMGLSISSVKTHYLRALHALRELLQGHWETQP